MIILLVAISIVLLCCSWYWGKSIIIIIIKERMNMANVFPPFKIDIAGAFCVPRALKDVREQYQNGQVSRQILQAVEDAEVRSLVERLELEA